MQPHTGHPLDPLASLQLVRNRLCTRYDPDVHRFRPLQLEYPAQHLSGELDGGFVYPFRVRALAWEWVVVRFALGNAGAVVQHQRVLHIPNTIPGWFAARRPGGGIRVILGWRWGVVQLEAEPQEYLVDLGRVAVGRDGQLAMG
jgi:hypothetical protein